MCAPIALPGAEEFLKYLQEHCKGQITIDKPRVRGKERAKEYAIYVGGVLLGHYEAYKPQDSEKNFVRTYYGDIPGMPKKVSLRYSNKGPLLRGKEPVKSNEWLRRDNNDIPFP